MKNNSMTGSNVQIINELKKFLVEISEDSTKRAKYVVCPQDFSRRRQLTFKLLVLFLVNAVKRSLSIELASFFSCVSSGLLCSKQAFSKQRRKLKAVFFHDWNKKLTESFYTHHESCRWKNFRVLSVDGSSVILPDRQEIREKYGYTTNQTNRGSAIARICVLYDVPNQLAINGLLHHYQVSEESVVLDVLAEENLRESLLLFDRGYLSYWLIYELQQRNTHFIMRAATNANNTVKDFLAGNQTDITVEYFPPYSSLKKLRDTGRNISSDTSVKIRMVKIPLKTGEIEVLITNLYDSELYTLEDLAEAYHLRWGIETYYGYIKEELQLGVFSGLSPICVEQDFAATLFLFNLQSIIEKQCEPHLNEISSKRKYRYKVNKNISWSFLKHRIVKLFLEQDPRDILLELQRSFCRYLEPVRPHRSFPREKKRKPDAKHYILTNYKRAI